LFPAADFSGRLGNLMTADDLGPALLTLQVFGRMFLCGLTAIITYNTLLRWHRELVMKKLNYCKQRGKVGHSRTK